MLAALILMQVLTASVDDELDVVVTEERVVEREQERTGADVFFERVAPPASAMAVTAGVLFAGYVTAEVVGVAALLPAFAVLWLASSGVQYLDPATALIAITFGFGAVVVVAQALHLFLLLASWPAAGVGAWIASSWIWKWRAPIAPLVVTTQLGPLIATFLYGAIVYVGMAIVFIALFAPSMYLVSRDPRINPNEGLLGVTLVSLLFAYYSLYLWGPLALATWVLGHVLTVVATGVLVSFTGQPAEPFEGLKSPDVVVSKKRDVEEMEEE